MKFRERLSIILLKAFWGLFTHRIRVVQLNVQLPLSIFGKGTRMFYMILMCTQFRLILALHTATMRVTEFERLKRRVR